MAAQMKPEPDAQPGTAVARQRTPLPAHIQEKIDEARARNALVAQIRGTQWGKDASVETIRAVAEYGHRYGIDPVTEIEILGGRIYKNANYYHRRGAELTAAGVIDRVEVEHVAHDPRLDTIAEQATKYAAEYTASGDEAEVAYWQKQAKDAKREIVRRGMERVRVGATEGAAAVVVVRIYTPWLSEPVEGANWCGNGIRPVTKYGNPGDPIGDAEPTKTAETRALRRAWAKLAEAGKQTPTSSPLANLAQIEGRIGEEGAVVGEIVSAERAQIAAGHRAALPRPLITTGTDGYGDDAAASDTPAGGEPRSAAPAPVARRTSAAGASSTASGAQSEGPPALPLEEPQRAPRPTGYRPPPGGRVVDALEQTRGLDVARRVASEPDPYEHGEPGELTDEQALALDDQRRAPGTDALREGR